MHVTLLFFCMIAVSASLLFVGTAVRSLSFAGIQRLAFSHVPGVGAEERWLDERPCGQVHDSVWAPTTYLMLVLAGGCCTVAALSWERSL